MARNILYTRVSDASQSSEAQHAAMLADRNYDRTFTDEGVSGATLAATREGFKALLDNINSGDTLYVYAVDRLGRDAIDVQTTVRALLTKGVGVHIRGLGLMAEGVGQLIIGVLAQVAEMERKRIVERTANGREVARASLAATGKTHRGKDSLGRPALIASSTVIEWRTANKASIATTAKEFNISDSTVKRYAADEAKKAAKALETA